MTDISPVAIEKALSEVREHWTPRVVGRVNDQYIKVAKLLGELVWHAHDAGEFFVVPRGVLHNPIADDEVGIVLIETVTTAHTGAVVIDQTVPIERQVNSQ